MSKEYYKAISLGHETYVHLTTPCHGGIALTVGHHIPKYAWWKKEILIDGDGVQTLLKWLKENFDE
jgi:hypothetical protein